MLYTAFILGLLGSMHCVGMCGPIAFMLPVDRENSWRKATQVFLYHFGRILTYSIMGLLFGLIGKGLYLFGMQQQLSIGLGIFMILAVTLPFVFVKKLKITGPYYKWLAKLRSSLGSLLKKRTYKALFTIGILNGFLPCGLVYMAIIAAVASGGALEGAMYMAFFGVGTIPLMTIAVYSSKFISTKFKLRIQKLVPVFVVLIGVLFILRGMGLGIPFISPEPMSDLAAGVTQMNCH